MQAPTINSDFFVLTYGAIVASLVDDLKDPEEVNRHLDTLGFNIGCRMIDEFLAATPSIHCTQFHQTAQGICAALTMFLGCRDVKLSTVQTDSGSYEIKVMDNPLERYCKLPSQLGNLSFSQIICGAIRGALSMIGFNVKVTIVPTEAGDQGAATKSLYGRPLGLRIDMLSEIQEAFVG